MQDGLGWENTKTRLWRNIKEWFVNACPCPERLQILTWWAPYISSLWPSLSYKASAIGTQAWDVSASQAPSEISLLLLLVYCFASGSHVSSHKGKSVSVLQDGNWPVSNFLTRKTHEPWASRPNTRFKATEQLKLSPSVISSQQNRANPQSNFIYWKTITADVGRTPQKPWKFPESQGVWYRDRFNLSCCSLYLNGELNLIFIFRKE